MSRSAAIAEFKRASDEAKRHHFAATREVEDTSAEPDATGQYPTTTKTLFDGAATVVDEEMRVKRDTNGADYDAEAYVRVSEWPAGAPMEGVSAAATFAGVKRPCEVVGVERSDLDDFVYVRFTGRGVAV